MTWQQFKTPEIEQLFASVSPDHAAAIENVCETMFEAGVEVGIEAEREGCARAVKNACSAAAPNDWSKYAGTMTVEERIAAFHGEQAAAAIRGRSDG